MAPFQKSVTPSWGSLATTDSTTESRLRTGGPGYLARCGRGRDAVVMPLARGLAVLDALELPVQDGYSVIADRLRQELIVVVDDGWVHLWDDAPGVRVLSGESWLLVPAPGSDGTWAASWLSQPPRPAAQRRAGDDESGGPSLGRVGVGIDVRALREAFTVADRTAVAS
ncbi:hypothetical protein [Streptomyces tendae]|uniref:hypothetical protein n=1 Tax=Streptomyces tendae TaxID=1932 RepID=UPI003EBD1ACD